MRPRGWFNRARGAGEQRLGREQPGRVPGENELEAAPAGGLAGGRHPRAGRREAVAGAVRMGAEPR